MHEGYIKESHTIRRISNYYYYFGLWLLCPLDLDLDAMSGISLSVALRRGIGLRDPIVLL